MAWAGERGRFERLVDIRSVVTAAPDPAVPTAVVKHATPLDKLNVVAQQFMTTLRMPMGKPALICGSTLLPAELPARDQQLYLFLDVATAAVD